MKTMRIGPLRASIRSSIVFQPMRERTMRPLEQIASGGELSRVMLALKASVEAGTNSAGHSTATTKKKLAAQRTLVFDEIDTGIGGRAAEAVGKN